MYRFLSVILFSVWIFSKLLMESFTRFIRAYHINQLFFIPPHPLSLFLSDTLSYIKNICHGIISKKLYFSGSNHGDNFLRSKQKKQELTFSLRNLAFSEVFGGILINFAFATSIPFDEYAALEWSVWKIEIFEKKLKILH